MDKTYQLQAPCLGALVCHPPLLLPAIGKGQEKEPEMAKVDQAYRKIAADLQGADPQTVVLFTPHAPYYLDYIQLSDQPVLQGRMERFGDFEDRFEIRTDQQLVKAITRLAGQEGFPMGVLGEQEKQLDHGSMVPLYYLQNALPHAQFVRVSASGLSHFDHYQAGMLIQKAARSLGRRIALIASGDLSHCQKADGPYGYLPEGAAYDGQVMENLSKGDVAEILLTPESTVQKAMVCGHAPLCMMLGAFEGSDLETEVLAHTAPFGVGYGMAQVRENPQGGNPHWWKKASKRKKERFSRRVDLEDAWIALARKSVEAAVSGQPFQWPENLPAEMLQKQAGVFVSLHLHGQLRGCMGTTAPTQENVAREITVNAFQAAAADPRFAPVEKRELMDLDIHVDVLGSPSPCQKEDLDPLRYGVIVRKGKRQGVLLPDLEGIDSAEVQLAVAKDKAGIGRREKGVEIERFTVVRHALEF